MIAMSSRRHLRLSNVTKAAVFSVKYTLQVHGVVNFFSQNLFRNVVSVEMLVHVKL